MTWKEISLIIELQHIISKKQYHYQPLISWQIENQDSKSPIQNQINESREILDQKEINKYMANFLQERNDLNKNLEEKNNQLSLEKSEPTKSQN